MRKVPAFFLCLLLLFGLVSGAAAQSVPCPRAGLTLTVPDSWKVVPLNASDDPDLCLLLSGKDISLSVYVSEAAGAFPDAFQVFTGDETASGTVTLGGREMTYVAGKNSDGDYQIYTWIDRKSQVQFWFVITAKPKTAQKTIDEVMNTLKFE